MSRLQDGEIGGLQQSGWNRRNAAAELRCTIPSVGRSWSEIRAELVARKKHDYDWRAGRVPIYVYFDDEELLSVSREAYSLYFSENALGRRAFPSVACMEEEIVQMSLSLFRAPEGAGGSFTSGGTESIFLALKAARDRFRDGGCCKVRPTVIAPRTAHPAFDKAAHYLDIDVIRVGIGNDLRGDLTEIRAAIDDRTMMVVGSAPCYPYGVYDCLAALSDIAGSRQLWLHADACLGGFLAPFARDEGFLIPEFDFALPGVTSISADLHKYGFSAKGASILLYRSASLLAYQGFRFDNWPRGIYSTETFLGSRPGGAIASAWAVTQYLGLSGYRRLARITMEAKQRLISGIETIAGLEVIYPSELSIVLYRSNDPGVNINAVGEEMMERGWFVGTSREPEALHLALNAVHAPAIEAYVRDLRSAVEIVRASGRTAERDELTY